MDPITRVRMHRGFYYDIAGQPSSLLCRAFAGTTLVQLDTIHGQRVWVTPSHVESVEDLSTQPKLLEYAWEQAKTSREYPHGKES